MVNWDRPDWGGHVQDGFGNPNPPNLSSGQVDGLWPAQPGLHMDTHGSWLDAEQTDTDGGAA